MEDRERGDERAEPPEHEATEDLDVPGQDTDDVKGGGGIATSDAKGDPVATWSFQQAWPKKWSG